MKSFLFTVLKFFTFCTGAAVTGILMIPAGILVFLISVIWNATDKLMSKLDKKEGGE